MALDFFKNRLDSMIDMRHPLAILSNQLPWSHIEESLRPLFERPVRPLKSQETVDLLGTQRTITGGQVSAAGRPRKEIRLMVSLLMLKHSFNLSDEEVVIRFSENVVWQYFAGYAYYDPSLPCDGTQIGRFRKRLGEAGLEELLRYSIETAVQIQAVTLREFDKVIVDTTVQEKAIAHPNDSRLLEIARAKLVQQAKRDGIVLKQTYAKEGKALRFKAGGYAHAKQFKRLKRVVKRQRTLVGILVREITRKVAQTQSAPSLKMAQTLERAQRIHSQQPKDKGKLYAFHAPEVECIGKGKARKPYEFGVKVALAVTHKNGLMVGARSFTGNPYDGHILSAQMEQTTILLERLKVKPGVAVVDLGFRGIEVQRDNPGLLMIHRGKFNSLTQVQRKWLKRRQAIEPSIGHLKADYRMGKCYLRGELGDALHAVSCAIGYNIAWLLRAIVRKGRKAFKTLFFALQNLRLQYWLLRSFA
jgi:transposase, IS5 family